MVEVGSRAERSETAARVNALTRRVSSIAANNLLSPSRLNKKASVLRRLLLLYLLKAGLRICTLRNIVFFTEQSIRKLLSISSVLLMIAQSFL